MAQVAKTSAKNKSSFYSDQYQRISMKRGKGRATIAIAHSMLISIYHMLKEGKDFEDLGTDYYNQFNTQKKINSYLKKLEALGYEIDQQSQNTA